MTATNGSRPLEGVRVADFSWFGVGPIAARTLSDFGADVIRIESEARVDGLRLGQPIKPGKTGYNVCAYFNNFNADKRSFLLNMSAEGSQEVGLPADRTLRHLPLQPHPAHLRALGTDLRETLRGETRHHCRLHADAGPERSASRLPRLRRGADPNDGDLAPLRRPRAKTGWRGHQLPGLRRQSRPHRHRDSRRAAPPSSDRPGPTDRIGPGRVGRRHYGTFAARLHGQRRQSVPQRQQIKLDVSSRNLPLRRRSFRPRALDRNRGRRRCSMGIALFSCRRRGIHLGRSVRHADCQATPRG